MALRRFNRRILAEAAAYGLRHLLRLRLLFRNMVRIVLAFIVPAVALVVFACIPAFAQDGSDMRYVKADELDVSHLGLFAHLDFGRRSFARVGDERKIDSVTLRLAGKNVVFTEHREDDGHNNWFRYQYLQSESFGGGLRLRLTKTKIVGLNKGTIRVVAYFAYYDDKGNRVGNSKGRKAFSKMLSFPKNTIAEVLIKSGD
jgi:hypothetical protein